MKRLIPIVCFLLFGAGELIHAQVPEGEFQKKDLLTTSRRQASGGRALLICGAALTGTGLVFINNNPRISYKSGAGLALITLGALTMIGSIPLFMASSRNKARAHSIEASLQYQQVPLILPVGRRGRVYQAVALHLAIQ